MGRDRKAPAPAARSELTIPRARSHLAGPTWPVPLGRSHLAASSTVFPFGAHKLILLATSHRCSLHRCHHCTVARLPIAASLAHVTEACPINEREQSVRDKPGRRQHRRVGHCEAALCGTTYCRGYWHYVPLRPPTIVGTTYPPAGGRLANAIKRHLASENVPADAPKLRMPCGRVGLPAHARTGARTGTARGPPQHSARGPTRVACSLQAP